uniref:uncharacterized protein LOC120953669 isoform X3 n=1 Tax=Anopheles coluzzii TaxID=1518534 RepID=UPI0020FF85C7|nr:uncharacterized protein LOC120953669 isoform X3 [Anopheles coluzzii]
MSSGPPRMGAEGKMASASSMEQRVEVADSHSVQLLGAIETSPSSLSSSSSLPAEVNLSGKEHSVDSNFLTPRAAREGTPPRADAQIEVGLPPRVPPTGCVSSGGGGGDSSESNSTNSSTAGAQPTAEASQPKKKVIRRIVKVRRVVKKMKKKDEKFSRRVGGCVCVCCNMTPTCFVQDAPDRLGTLSLRNFDPERRGRKRTSNEKTKTKESRLKRPTSSERETMTFDRKSPTTIDRRARKAPTVTRASSLFSQDGLHNL